MAISILSAVVLPFVILLVFYLTASLRAAFRPGLRKLPGPLLARFSGTYRLSLVYGGNALYEYRRLHQKYGTIVRAGPNHVSVSDPAAIPQIYGIGRNYLKVSKFLRPKYCG